MFFKLSTTCPLMLSVVLCFTAAAAADMLVRFPLGTDADRIAPLVDALKQSAKTPVLSVSAQASSQDAAKVLPDDLQQKQSAAEKAYKNLALENAVEILKDTDIACLKRASFESCCSFLFETALLRGMSLFALGRASEADIEFQSAHFALPTKVLDPKKYSPSILRAFAAACAFAESAPQAEVRLNADPKDAFFFEDGRPVASTRIRLSPGRHVVEARLEGFENAVALVEVNAEGVAKSEISFTLKPLGDLEAWTALTVAISADTWNPTDPGIASLLSRFRIGTVLMLDFSQDGAFMNARLARTGKKDMIELPLLARPCNSLPAAFSDALQIALGISPSKAQKNSGAIDGPQPPNGEYIDDSEDEEDVEEANTDEEEDPAIRFQPSDKQPPQVPAEKKSIIKSPWFWISVGVVTAIVSGVIIAVQVQD